jgi:hypothetical protein
VRGGDFLSNARAVPVREVKQEGMLPLEAAPPNLYSRYQQSYGLKNVQAKKDLVDPTPWVTNTILSLVLEIKVWLIRKIYVAVLYMCKRVPHRGTPARIACRKWQARWRTRVSPARSCSTTSDVDEHSKCTGMSGWKAPGGGTAYSLFFTIQLVPIEKVVYMMNSE